MKRALTILISLLAVGIAPASAASFGTISGTVTSAASGAGLEGVCVSAWSDPYLPASYAGAMTGPDGSYAISATAGRYIVEFWDCADDGAEHLTEYYDDAFDYSDADRVLLTPAGVEGIDAELDVAATIEGRITDARGTPLRDVCVEGSRSAGGSYGYTNTSPDGTYVMSGLRPGAYRVAFVGSCIGTYANEYYDDAATWEDADLVHVGQGQTVSSIDASLERLPGTGTGYEGFSGIVTDLEGTPLAYGACVQAYRAGEYDWDFVAQAFVDETGRYTLPVRPGTYALHASGCGSDVQGEWFEDASSIYEATFLEVTEETFTTVDFALAWMPETDISVQIAQVENVPVRTDSGPLPVQPGTQRRIHLRLTNAGDVGTAMHGAVFICPATVGGCEILDLERWLVPGVTHHVVDWDATGMAGDVLIDAHVNADGGLDRNYDNDHDRTRHYAVIGGTGAGAGIP